MQQSDLHVLVFEPDRERVQAFRRRMDAAGGVLTLPSWAGNCTCNYPLHTSLALVPMPPEFVQWSAWGEVAAEGWVRQVGINLGAPGNRVDEGGTLWLEHPQVGGPGSRCVSSRRVRPAFTGARCGSRRRTEEGSGQNGFPALSAKGLVCRLVLSLKW